LNELRESLLDLLSHLEAGFDFADEDIPFIARDELLSRLAEAGKQIADTLAQMASRDDSAVAERAVLLGRPNAGKSSLFNALTADRAALVCDLPGTTRDYLIAELDLEVVKCRLIDTAGRRGERGEKREERRERRETELPLAASQDIDSAAQSFTAEQHAAADVQVLCIDSTRPPDEWEIARLQDASDRRRIVVFTKCDLPDGLDHDCPALRTSSVTGEGIDRLRGELRRKMLAARAGRSEVVAETAVRCRDSLRLAGLSVELASRVASLEQDELAAAEIRIALDELGKVVGAVYTDDVLDRIFSRFCIGK
ncbi:MAG: 50S ribosome-binding GTPase, partial [Pirellulales bacterium]|nr:50S ribosome-binding GTPase [Pirellulales bacterium]